MTYITSSSTLKNAELIESGLEGFVAGELMDRLVCELDLPRAVSDADFVIEAVPGRLDVKQEHSAGRTSRSLHIDSR